MPKKKVLKDPKEKFRFCVRAALDKKAENVVLIDVSKLSSFADYFLICHGQSSRQVMGIAKHIEEKMGEAGFRPLGIEGYREGKWILIDYDDIVVHIFQKPVREFYDLERLWIEAPHIEIGDEKSLKANA
ncbi:MAG: ribosome silencing factor [Pseudomonadota bacterium]